MQLLTPAQLQQLLNQQCISDQHPWCTNDSKIIEKFYVRVCADVERKSRVKSSIEWNHYGSGYASYIDAWFFRNTPDFEDSTSVNVKLYSGLSVLFSRLSHYFVFLEGSKFGRDQSSGYFLPEFNSVDALRTSAVINLAKEIQPILENYGLRRLSRQDLSALLPSGTVIDTNLSSRAYREFDALFNWMD